MDLTGKLESVDSADGDKSSYSGSNVKRMITRLRKKLCCQRRTVPSSGESRYLTPLLVFANGEPSEELHRIHSSHSRSTGSELVDHEELKDKIRAAFKLLLFRDKHILIQFWSPHAVGRHQLLTTVDQPFGFGVADEGFCLYRMESEQNLILVDKDHEEDDLSPPARVFRKGLPEWTCDVAKYSSKEFPQQECAINCKLSGYLALPVFDSTTGSCVGVLELLTSKNVSYAYEVQQIYVALQKVNLTTVQPFDRPTTSALNEGKENKMDKIHDILKAVCDLHSLTLAQTWGVSPFSTTYVSHENNPVKSCSSFDTRCIGRACMTTTGLPYSVGDNDMWSFWGACREQHLEKSQGVVGRALLSRGSCYCGDVTQLSKEEYPLVHNARMSGLSSCFAIYLHDVKDDNNDGYVLEFFLPLNIKDDSYISKLVQTLKQKVEEASGFELGDISTSILVVGEVDNMSLNIEPQTIHVSSTTMKNVDTTDNVIVLNQENHLSKCSSIIIENTEILARDDEDVINESVDVVGASVVQKTMDGGEKSNQLKQGIKRKIDTLTLEAVEQQFGKPLNDAAKNLGVSRSTLKRFCRENGISRWPSAPNRVEETAYVSESEQALQRQGSSNVMMFADYPASMLTPNIKTWNSSADWQHSNFDTVSSSGWSENYVSDMDSELSDMEHTLKMQNIFGYLANVNLDVSNMQKTRDAEEMSNGLISKLYRPLTLEEVEQQVGNTCTEAANNLGVTTFQLTRFYRKHFMTGWPHPKPRERNAKKSCSGKVLQRLLKQRSAMDFVPSSSERSEANVSDMESGLSDYENTPNIQTPSTSTSNQQHSDLDFFSSLFCDDINFIDKVREWQVFESTDTHMCQPENEVMPSLRNFNGDTVGNFIDDMPESQKPCSLAQNDQVSEFTAVATPQARFGIYEAAMANHNVVTVSDTRMRRVKAYFKDLIIRFKLPPSSGLSELKNEVARYIKFKSNRLLLKYKDEDGDLILIACDADLQELLQFPAIAGSNNTIKLIIQMADD